MRMRRATWLTVAAWASALIATASAQERLLAKDLAHEASAPHVAVGEDGTVAAVFAVEDEVWCSVSRDGGKTFAAPARVGAAGKLEYGLARGPKVAVTGTSIAIVAICGATLRGQDGDALAWRSADRGATWSEPVRINTVAGAAREGLQALAAGPEGKLICVWLDLRQQPLPGDASPAAEHHSADAPAGGTELWGAWSEDGGATWSADTLIYQSPDGTICECCAPAVTFDPLHGHAVVFWRNKLGENRDMFAMIVKRGDERGVDRAMAVDPKHWELKACPMAGGGVAVSATGTLLTFWRREGGLYATTPGLGEVDAIGEGREAAAASGPGGFHLLWTDGEGRVMTAFDARQAEERQARALGHGYNTAVAGAPDGQGPVLAVWETGEPGAEALRVAVLAERQPPEQN